MADCITTILGCPGGMGPALLEDEPQTYRVRSSEEKKDETRRRNGRSPSPSRRGRSKPPSKRRKSKSPKRKSNPNRAKEITHLPILIVPGFMSSGLEIKASQSRPDWVGKRLWLNLGSLGLSALYFGSAQKDKEYSAGDEQQQHQYKSAWLEHMRLDETDFCSDPPGSIKVRPIQGLEGVDYLTPGAFTNHVSYVFGPVIRALQKEGYQEGVNLQAAPYDWRLPPSQLERRDGYFSGLIRQVEELYHNNHGTPVVIVGHSLGTKTAHYFLNFALQHKGQAWLDRHVHTYLPVGAPHLGAPKALRSVVVGDKMGLDAFLNDEEALALGRSFGSGPWLFPTELPKGVPSSVYVLPHGVLEMSFEGDINVHELVRRRTALSKPNRYSIMVGYGTGAERMVHSPFVDANLQDRVAFRDKVSFATHPNARDAARYGRLSFFLQEPGLAVAKEEVEENTICCIIWTPICCLLRWITCCCICDYLYRLIRWILCGILFRGVALSADAITSGAGGGANLAFSNPIPIPHEVWTGKEAARQIMLFHKDDYEHPYEQFLCFIFHKQPRTATLRVKFRWIPYQKEGSVRAACSAVCQPNFETNPQLIVSSKKEQYQGFAGHDILEREGLEGTLQLINGTYDGDSAMGPRSLSSIDAPPVQRIHAIYGINLNTEVGCVYRRKDRCLSDNALKNLYKIDAKASLATKSSGFSLQNGILYETRKTAQANGRSVSGDGTVPIWSLEHCKTWKAQGRDVSVVELDKAEHREILADHRFHKALLGYCRIQKESV